MGVPAARPPREQVIDRKSFFRPDHGVSSQRSCPHTSARERPNRGLDRDGCFGSHDPNQREFPHNRRRHPPGVCRTTVRSTGSCRAACGRTDPPDAGRRHERTLELSRDGCRRLRPGHAKPGVPFTRASSTHQSRVQPGLRGIGDAGRPRLIIPVGPVLSIHGDLAGLDGLGLWQRDAQHAIL